MGMLRSDHPDIRRFINAKRDKVGFTNFNTSVAVTDDFMDAVIGGRPWTLRDHNGRPTETVDAPALFDDIVSSAWECGDPGLIFITRVNTTRSNPVTSLGPIEATNPCGEQPLYPYDSCNLGSINLFNHLLAFPSNDEDTFDWNRLRQTVHLAVRFLDDVIDANVYPLPEITKMAKNIRRIGLGVMGWADCLFALGIPYDSATSRDLARRVMSFISDEADNMSEELADRRDVFPLWYDSIYSGVRRLRNSTRTTIAPTGTISIIAGCSSGIEPAFALVFKRQHKLDKNDPNANTEMFETNPVLLSTIRSLSPDYVVDKIVSQLASGSHPTNIAEFPQHLVNVFATAHDISPFGHLGMQEAFQAHVDNAVSKTINLPNSATKSDVNTVYRQAYDMNLKGITIYRDGSKAGQVLSVPGALTVVATTAVTPPPTTKPARTKLPKTRDSITHKFRIGDNEGYLTVGLFPDGKPGELFIRLNREGNAISGFADGVCIATSIALQHGVPLDLFVKKYRNTKFEPSGLTDDPDIRSCTSVLDYVFRWLELRFLSASPPDAVSGDPCACGGTFIKQEGCAKCPSCGESRC